MYYQLHLDIFLIQEFVMNIYVLLLCKICFISTVGFRRIVCGAVFLAFYQTLLLVIPYPSQLFLFYGMLWSLNVIGACLGIRLCFGKIGIKVYIKRVSTYMILVLVTGGIFMGILPRFVLFRNSAVKLFLFIVTGAFSYGLLKRLFLEKRKTNYYGKVQIRHKGVVLEGQYFMDSGNSLVESISKKPVLLACEKWLFEEIRKEELFFRPVVYKSVGSKKGILYAYCMDELIIHGKKGAYTYEKVWVGVCREDLFSGRNYQIILPPFYGGWDQ